MNLPKCCVPWKACPEAELWKLHGVAKSPQIHFTQHVQGGCRFPHRIVHVQVGCTKAKCKSGWTIIKRDSGHEGVEESGA